MHMDIKQAIQELAISVHNGYGDPAETYAILYSIGKACDEAIASVKEAAIDEVKKYGKEGVSHFGLTMTTKSAAGRWVYKGVAVHAELQARLKLVEELAQTAYRTGGGIADPDGQLVEPATYIPGGDTIVCNKLKQ